MLSLQNGVLFFGLVTLVQCYWSVMHFLAPPPRRRWRHRFAAGLSHLCWQIVLLYWLAATHGMKLWNEESVGASIKVHWLLSFTVGFALYFAFLGINRIASGLTGTRSELGLRALQVMGNLWPSRRSAKALALVALCLNPFTEEMIFRGIMVRQLHELSGSLVLAVAVGLVLCLLVHLYQGLQFLPFHAAFFAVAISILYSPLGMAGAVGLHLAGDLFPVLDLSLAMRRSWGSWRAALRFQRSGTTGTA
jgi:membrane protease YdiL (CAAX protease family)